MAATAATDIQVGAGHIYRLATIIIALHSPFPPYGVLSAPGYIMPDLKSLKLSHSGTIDRIKNQAGAVSPIIGNDDILSCGFDFIPEASSRALAAVSAMLPALATPVDITGCPLI